MKMHILFFAINSILLTIAGIKMIITYPELNSDTENAVRFFMNHQALAGYFVGDEPNDQQAIIDAGILAGKIRAIDKNHYCYLNLKPGSKTKPQGGVSYATYLDWYAQYFKPEFISFDTYPIIIDRATRITSERTDWCDNCRAIASFSESAAKPFWAFTMAVSHIAGTVIVDGEQHNAAPGDVIFVPYN